MKNKFLLSLVLFLSVFGLSSILSANTITVSGQYEHFDADGDHLVDDISISKVLFNVTAGTTVTFDILANEHDDNNSGADIDLNGDSEITYADTYIMLFDSLNSQLATDDDGGVGSDGSTCSFDSYMTYTFSTAGEYFLTIGELSYEITDAILGYALDDSIYGGLDHSDWRLTMIATDGSISMDSNPVPEPATMLLFGLGLLGLAGVNRRKQ